jgi:Bacterial Ig-like domain (group 3)
MLMSGETVTANVGTLPAGGSVIIKYQVTVNNPPNLTLLNPPRISNQGSVSGSNFSTVLTDDPNEVGPANPTVTLIDLFDTTTTLGSAPNPSNLGQQVTFTATVSENPTQATADPTGNVDFIDTSNGNAVICDDVPLNGSFQATCQTTTLTVGTHVVRADYLGDGNFDPSQSNTVSQDVTASVDINVRDAKAAEPTSGTTNMLFTIILASAATGTVTVDYATADEAPGPGKAVGGATCGSGADYQITSGTASFSAGQQIKTIAVPICSDATGGEPDETFLFNLSNATGGTIVDGQAIGTITAANTAGTFVISEIRTTGPGGAGDDFVEVYNNSNSPLTVAASDASAGYGLFKVGGTCGATPTLIGTIPNGTVIPARSHYLFVGSTYSLSNYGGTGAAAGNLTLSSDIETDYNVGIFNTSDIANLSSVNRLDAVGFGTNTGENCDLLREGTILPSTGSPLLEGSYQRDVCGKLANSAFFGNCPAGGVPKDSNNNVQDFYWADTAGTNTPAGQHLGAPGPENIGSPIVRNAPLPMLLLDATKAASIEPNRGRSLAPVTNGANGTLTIRRRIRNDTGGAVTRLRFRIIDISTLPVPGGVADMRALDSIDVIISNILDSQTCLASTGSATTPCTITVNGTVVETPPAQAMGGATNSTYTVTLGTPLAAGASVNVQWVLGLQSTGSFKFFLNVEALP